jgi:cold shock CspA family protein
MRTEGTLRNWNDERGFGFIVTAETKQDVFVHISALPQTARRPQPGERLAFSIETGHDGKKRVVGVSYLDPPTAASLAAASRNAATTAPSRARGTKRTASPDRGDRGRRGHEHGRPGVQRRFGSALTLLALCGIGAAIMSSETLRGLLSGSMSTTTVDSATYAPSTPSSAAQSFSATAAAAPFQCDGRTHCSQMTSCAEARYFLRHCPGVEMDGNGDGEPCERQWCH